MLTDRETGECAAPTIDVGLAIESRTRYQPGGEYAVTGIVWAFDGERYHTAHVYRKQLQLDSIDAADARPVSGMVMKGVVRDTMKFIGKAIADGSTDSRLVAALVRLEAVLQ